MRMEGSVEEAQKRINKEPQLLNPQIGIPYELKTYNKIQVK